MPTDAVLGPLPGDPQRAYDIDQLRIKVVNEALEWAGRYFDYRQQGGGHRVATEQADTQLLHETVLALADKIREPDHCTQCGQVVPPEDDPHLRWCGTRGCKDPQCQAFERDAAAIP